MTCFVRPTVIHIALSYGGVFLVGGDNACNEFARSQDWGLVVTVIFLFLGLL